VLSDDNVYPIPEIFEPHEGTASRRVLQSDVFERTERELFPRAAIVVDDFPEGGGTACGFMRLLPGKARIARLAFHGAYRVEFCPSGGWLLNSAEVGTPSYWIPQSPVLRTIDSRARILSEQPAPLVGFSASATSATADIEVPADTHLDCTFWRLPPGASDIVAALERPLVLELQPVFMWGSHTLFRGPADTYRYVVHGHVYENRYEWRYKWKICAENEAYALYVTLHGLELATGKRLYGLLKRQVLFSVISRQSEDGGWYHGEWSDFMESHFRMHNGAVLLMAAALEERPDRRVRDALEKAAAFTSRHADETSLGLWFLHDSLEEDIDLLRKSGSRLIPSRVLGKSPATKMILNTHLDAIVALDRYREVTGDDRYADRVASARNTTRALLGLRPAEALYRVTDWAVRLALRPPSEAQRLPLVLRAVRRAAREHLLPRLHRIKRQFPRMVMPGGLIERHLSMPHFDVNYQTVNIMDLVRVWRRFPDEDFAGIVANAVRAVRDTGLLRYWIETKQRQALAFWLEALFQICTLVPAREYRQYLAEAILICDDAELGMAPSTLGANPEAARPDDRMPCPSPTEPCLRVANLSRGGRREILVVNCSSDELGLAWQANASSALAWTSADDRPVPAGESSTCVPPRGWLLGIGDCRSR
jgi:hypothetical protein